MNFDPTCSYESYDIDVRSDYSDRSGLTGFEVFWEVFVVSIAIDFTKVAKYAKVNISSEKKFRSQGITGGNSKVIKIGKNTKGRKK